MKEQDSSGGTWVHRRALIGSGGMACGGRTNSAACQMGSMMTAFVRRLAPAPPLGHVLLSA